MSSLEFLLYITIIVFVLFSGVDYYIAQVQHSIIEEATDHYMGVMSLSGTLSDVDRQTLQRELEERGLQNIQINAQTLDGTQIVQDLFIVRDVQNPNNSIMILEVIAEPRIEPFALGRLIGVREAGNFQFIVRRRAFSELPIQ